MKKEQVLELMNTVPADLIEEADIQAPAKRRMPKVVRTGLIAACLCLALLGTAFAANPEAVASFIRSFAPIQVEPVSTWGDETNGYQFSYEMTGYPIDSFSPALLAAGEDQEEYYLDRFFDTWAEVCAFIGEDIPCFLPAAAESWDVQFVVRPQYNQGELLSVDVSTYDPTFSYPSILMIIATEYYSGDDSGMTHMWMTIPGCQAELLSPYPMANGGQAEIALFTFPADPEDSDTEGIVDCIATFVQDGIQYRVHNGGRFKEEQLAKLYHTLDLFP